MQRTRVASLRSPLTPTVMRPNNVRRPRRMVVHSLKPDPAGSVLRTTGEPRRGRCKKGTGADCAVSDPTSFFHGQCLGIAISAGPAPHRFAPPAAPFSCIQSSGDSDHSFGRGAFNCAFHARPRSACAPGRSSAESLSVLVVPSAIVPSRIASATARCARRGFPGRPHPRSAAASNVPPGAVPHRGQAS